MRAVGLLPTSFSLRSPPADLFVRLAPIHYKTGESSNEAVQIVKYRYSTVGRAKAGRGSKPAPAPPPPPGAGEYDESFALMGQAYLMAEADALVATASSNVATTVRLLAIARRARGGDAMRAWGPAASTDDALLYFYDLDGCGRMPWFGCFHNQPPPNCCDSATAALVTADTEWLAAPIEPSSVCSEATARNKRQPCTVSLPTIPLEVEAKRHELMMETKEFMTRP